MINISDLILREGNPLSKDNLAEIGEQFAQVLLDNGEDDPLKAYIQLKAQSAVLDAAISKLKEAATDEAAAYAQKERVMGVTIECRRSPARWSYDDGQLDALKTKVRDRQKYLQTLPDKRIDPLTGEVDLPAVKVEGTIGVVLSFPKFA